AHDTLRQSFDLVTARAVAALPVLIELCGPFVKVGGHFCALKSNIEGELEIADKAGRVLGLTNIAVIDYEIPGGDKRCLVLYRKTSPTPAKYPRRYAEITKRALG
ncbi:MAG: class I SAM-dependent methyltransferase, partial [Clostridia bacterium]|nr:class I SAM-dependent methyltransferase [Clostridia bacterium]